MNKSKLISAIAEKTLITKRGTANSLSALVDVVTEELAKGGKVQLVGFGTFDVAQRVARKGRNPQTGKPMNISASKAPRFRAGKALKDAVKK